MRSFLLSCFGFCWGMLLPVWLTAQDTFSIVAVDTATGEIGSAGATCLDLQNSTSGALIISDILPGRGAIHTQAYWNGTNQSNARLRMEAGDSPQEIIDWLLANDAGGFGGDSSFRQYGIVDVDANGLTRTAAFTGINTDDYKSHIVGPNYAIQGNILLGQQILDSMESRFLAASGTLANKLMAAMQGANVPGADMRCLSEGVSSRSAFLRVSRPYDLSGEFYLDLSVLQTPFGAEPIDSLQALYNNWSPPNCGFVIPATATLVNGNQATTGSGGTYWVCAGDTLTVASSSNAVYLESGAVLRSQAGAGITTAYVREGAVFDGMNTAFNTLYIESGSLIEAAGLAVTSISCDSIWFDYSQAPAGGCNELTSLETAGFAPENWGANLLPHQEALLLSYRGDRPIEVSISLMAVSGKRVLFQSGRKFAGGEQLRLPTGSLPTGLYFVLIQGEQGRWISRVLIP